jgi:hypothetical protein
MQELFGWARRVALAALLIAVFYVCVDHFITRERITLGGMNDAWTLGSAPSSGAGAELCTFFSSPPPVFTSSQLGQVRCDANQNVMVDVTWANNRTIITPASPTTCTNISNVRGSLVEVINSSSSPQPQTLSLFDDGGSSCLTGTQIYAVTLSSSASPILMIPLSNGLAYTLTGAANANITITYQK